MEFYLGNWTPDERKEALEHTLEDYLEHLQRPSRSPQMPHYEDYLRSMVHELTRPAPSLWIGIPRVDDDDEEEFNYPDADPSDYDELEPTRRGMPASVYNEAVERYMADMSGYLDEQEEQFIEREEGEDVEEEFRECPQCKGVTRFTCVDDEWVCSYCLWSKESEEYEVALDDLFAESVKTPAQTPESAVEEGETDDDDLVWVWCPDCCIKLLRSIAQLDDPCHICNSQLSTAVPNDWEVLQLRRFRGPDQLPVHPEEPEEPETPEEPEEVKEAQDAFWPTPGGMRKRWCPRCQCVRMRTTGGRYAGIQNEPNCLVCLTPLVDDIPTEEPLAVAGV